jgi:hypothetical protein
MLQSTLDRAKTLLEARKVRRPVETLLPLAQRCLTWWTTVHGNPMEDRRGLRTLQREFRSLAFECGPGKTPRWAKEQSAEAEALFKDLVLLAANMPHPSLPAFGDHLREEARPVLLQWLWMHLDYHVVALTIGLLESGLLAQKPEDPTFESQASLREKAVSTVGTLLTLAAYLSAPTGREMPIQDALLTVSALLNVLSEALEEAFALGGPRAKTLMGKGGWVRPPYPFNVADLDALAARQFKNEMDGSTP